MKERQPEASPKPEPQPLSLEWSNEAESVNLRLQIDEKLSQGIPPAAQEKMRQALSEMGHLFATISNNQELFVAAGAEPEQVFEIVTERVIDITYHLADIAAGHPQCSQPVPFNEPERDANNPLEEITAWLNMQSRETKPTHDEERVPKALFEGGWVSLSERALIELALAGADFRDLLARHLVGDWGDVGETEKMLNDEAVKHGELIRSVYKLGKRAEIWVTTEKNREDTFFELPDEAKAREQEEKG